MGGCYLSGSGQPICYEDYLDDWTTGCLVVGLAIGWFDCWVPCGLERHLPAWPHGRRGRCGSHWRSRRWKGDQWSQKSPRSGWIGATRFAVTAFGISYGKPWGLLSRQRAEAKFHLHIIIQTALVLTYYTAIQLTFEHLNKKLAHRLFLLWGTFAQILGIGVPFSFWVKSLYRTDRWKDNTHNVAY